MRRPGSLVYVCISVVLALLVVFQFIRIDRLEKELASRGVVVGSLAARAKPGNSADQSEKPLKDRVLDCLRRIDSLQQINSRWLKGIKLVLTRLEREFKESDDLIVRRRLRERMQGFGSHVKQLEVEGKELRGRKTELCDIWDRLHVRGISRLRPSESTEIARAVSEAEEVILHQRAREDLERQLKKKSQDIVDWDSEVN